MLFEGEMYQELQISVTEETNGFGQVFPIPKRVLVSQVPIYCT